MSSFPVLVGSETGLLKGVDLSQGEARCRNYHQSLSASVSSREDEITCMEWGQTGGDQEEEEVLIGTRNGTVRTFSQREKR